jgi:hypothetical protein
MKEVSMAEAGKLGTFTEYAFFDKVRIQTIILINPFTTRAANRKCYMFPRTAESGQQKDIFSFSLSRPLRHFYAFKVSQILVYFGVSYKASISTEPIVFILILRNKKTSKYAPGRAWVGPI